MVVLPAAPRRGSRLTGEGIEAATPGMDLQKSLDVISGKRRGLAGALLRGGLSLAEPGYRAAIALRNLAFDRGWKRIERVPVPVISVGNLTTGGTGKTPAVAWITNWLAAENARPAIVSRGYRSLDSAGNDEKRLMDELCPGVPHLQNRVRSAAAREAVERFDCGAVVLDDAFQHRQFHRDLDVVLVDALSPWGYGHLLPRGLLREPRSSLARADAVVMTRCGQIGPPERQSLKDEIARWTAAPILESRFEVARLVNSHGEPRSLAGLPQERVAAFCGIGNPAGFRRTLADLGVDLDDSMFRVFPDHHHYGAEDIQEIATWARSASATLLLATRKDLVKIPEASLGGIALWGLDQTLEFADSAPLVARLRELVSGGGEAIRQP